MDLDQGLCFLGFSSLHSTSLSRGLEEVTGWVPQGAENSKIGRRQAASIALALQDTALTKGPITGTHLKMVTLTPPPAGSAWACGSHNKGKLSNHFEVGREEFIVLKQLYRVPSPSAPERYRFV